MQVLIHCGEFTGSAEIVQDVDDVRLAFMALRVETFDGYAPSYLVEPVQGASVGRSPELQAPAPHLARSPEGCGCCGGKRIGLCRQPQPGARHENCR
jgi:hypothetical protein